MPAPQYTEFNTFLQISFYDTPAWAKATGNQARHTIFHTIGTRGKEIQSKAQVTRQKVFPTSSWLSSKCLTTVTVRKSAIPS